MERLSRDGASSFDRSSREDREPFVQVVARASVTM
jgi:hypothetical protein